MRLRLISMEGESDPLDGHYVVDYFPDTHEPDGSYDGGDLVTTTDESLARQFTTEEALALYQASPSCACHRLRADGKPNRPLARFHVEIS